MLICPASFAKQTGIQGCKLHFSPLSVTDDKQRDRNHPFSFPQCRQGNLGNRSMHLAAMQAWQCVCGGGGEGILRDTQEYKCLCCIQDHHQQFIRSL
jgi:hypothetical protein